MSAGHWYTKTDVWEDPASNTTPNLISAGKRTLVASTRTRMSVVRPEATAAPCRAARTRFFQVSPMRGRHLQGRQQAHPDSMVADTATWRGAQSSLGH